MLIPGEWLLCDDGVARPVIRGDVRTKRGDWKRVVLLVDSGADRTVLNSAILGWLRVTDDRLETTLRGVGGTTNFVEVATEIRLTTDQGNKITLRGQFAATESQGLEMSVIGRDVTDLFSVIIDRPGNVVCLLSQRHRYHIESI
jgi:hypothetical protein